jgi:hypothetical protein
MESAPKSKIVSSEVQEYKSIKEEIEKELSASLEKLKYNIELLEREHSKDIPYYRFSSSDSEGVDDKNDEHFSYNRVMEIEQSIKDLHKYMTELDLDKLYLDEKIEELNELEKLFRESLLSISKDQLN